MRCFETTIGYKSWESAYPCCCDVDVFMVAARGGVKKKRLKLRALEDCFSNAMEREASAFLGVEVAQMEDILLSDDEDS